MDSLIFNTNPLTTLDVDLGHTTMTTLDVDIGSSTTNPMWPPTTTWVPTLPTSPEPTSVGGGDTWTTAGPTVTDIIPSVTVTETITSPPKDDPAATTTSADDEEGMAYPPLHGSVSLGSSLLVTAGILYIMYLH